jgi:hypothetical protein
LRYIHPGQRYTNQFLPSWESRLTDDEVGRLIAHFQKDHPDTMERCRKRDFLASQVILKALRGIGYNYHAIIQMVVHSYEKLGRYVDLEQLAQSTVQRNRDSAHNHPESGVAKPFFACPRSRRYHPTSLMSGGPHTKLRPA